MERREREAGDGNAVIVLIYRVAWLGEREEKGKGDNAIVRGVCSLCYYLHE